MTKNNYLHNRLVFNNDNFSSPKWQKYWDNQNQDEDTRLNTSMYSNNISSSPKLQKYWDYHNQNDDTSLNRSNIKMIIIPPLLVR